MVRCHFKTDVWCTSKWTVRAAKALSPESGYLIYGMAGTSSKKLLLTSDLFCRLFKTSTPGILSLKEKISTWPKLQRFLALWSKFSVIFIATVRNISRIVFVNMEVLKFNTIAQGRDKKWNSEAVKFLPLHRLCNVGCRLYMDQGSFKSRKH